MNFTSIFHLRSNKQQNSTFLGDLYAILKPLSFQIHILGELGIKREKKQVKKNSQKTVRNYVENVFGEIVL